MLLKGPEGAKKDMCWGSSKAGRVVGREGRRRGGFNRFDLDMSR